MTGTVHLTGPLVALARRAFWIPIALSLVVGVALPDPFIPLYAHLEAILGLMLLTAFVKLDGRLLLAALRSPGPAIRLAVVKLVVTPVLVWYLAAPLGTELRVAFLLLAAMPQGVSTITLLDLVGGSVPLGTASLVVSYALIPVTIPLMLHLLAGAAAPFDYAALTLITARIVVIPLVLAQLLRAVLGARVERLDDLMTGLGIAAIVAATLGSAAAQAATFRSSLGFVASSLVALYGLYLFTGLLGWAAGRPGGADGAATGLVTALFCNNSLAIVLAAAAFPPAVVAVTVLSSVPWNTLPGPVRWFLTRQASREAAP